MLVKEILRYRPSTVGRIIRNAEIQREARFFYSEGSRAFVRYSSPYQVVFLRTGKRVFVNLHNGRIYEYV